ncbi:lipoprotein [Mesoplasma seiffertii]|uniref:lipoprotein n=1 Tax=Mesoplasma seiffertii TaxID=28224 RepID=UPI00047A52C9|nr:lipoprotein [Mesoplasma seiffertii]
MKKLLTILGALSITASASALVVACGPEKEENKNSIFIDENGNLKIDSEKLLEWYQNNGGFVNDSNQYLKNIYNLFAVAVLQDAADGKLLTDTNKSLYINEGLQDKLKTLLGNENSTDSTSIWGRANEKYKTLKNVTYKDDEKGLRKYLKGLFPNVKNDALEKAFKNNFILTDNDNSAFATLKRIVGFNSSYAASSWENGVEFQEIKHIELFANFMDTFKTFEMSTLSTDIATAIQTDTGAASLISQLVNAGGGLKAITDEANFETKIKTSTLDLSEIEFISAEQAKALTAADIKVLLNHMDETFDETQEKGTLQGTNFFKGLRATLKRITYDQAQGEKPFLNTKNVEVSHYFELLVNVPRITNGIEQQITDSGVFGFMKNSQKFLVDNYYQNKKPVALSEVLIPFKGSVADSQTISLKNFIPNKLDGTSDETKGHIDRLAGIVKLYENYISTSVGSSEQRDGETTTVNGASLTLAQAGMTQWDTIMRGKSDDRGIIDKNSLTDDLESKWNSEYYTAAKKTKLLTLDSSVEDYSNEYKYSIYDFINTENPQAKTIEAKDLAEADIEAILTANAFGAEDAKSIANAIVGNNNPDESEKLQNRRKEAAKAISFLDNLLKEINQHVEAAKDPASKVDETPVEHKNYVVVNAEEGIIAFIDNAGLHFSRIDGYKLLNDENIVEDQKQVTFKSNEAAYLKEVESFKNLEALSKNNNGQEALPFLVNGSLLGTNSSSKAAPVVNDEGNGNEGGGSGETPQPEAGPSDLKDNVYGTYGIKNIANINQSISNKYEKFLVNSSIATEYAKSSTVGSFYDFNIFDDVTKSLTADGDSSLPSYASWMWDYFAEIMGDGKQTEDLLTRYFDIPDSTTALKIKEAVSKVSINNYKNPADAYTSGMNEWNKTVLSAYKAIENSEINSEKLKFTPNSTILNNQEKTNALLSSAKFDAYKKSDSKAVRAATWMKKISQQVEFQYSAVNVDSLRKAGK